MWCCYLVSGCGVGGFIWVWDLGCFLGCSWLFWSCAGGADAGAVLDVCLVVMLGGVVGLGSPGLLCCLWVGVI